MILAIRILLECSLEPTHTKLGVHVVRRCCAAMSIIVYIANIDAKEWV